MTRTLRILAALAVLLLSGTVLQAQDTAKQESRRDALRKEIAQLEQQLKENASKSNNAMTELKLVRKQVATRRELVAESEREIRALSDTIAARQAAAERLRERLATMESYYRKLIRNAYKNRDARVWYSLLLSSKNFGQATRRYVYLRDLSGTMNSQARRLQAMRRALEDDLARLTMLKEEAEAVRKAREQDLQSLRQEELRSDRLVADLQKDKNRYQKELNTKRKQVEALNREIERIIAQAVEEARKKEAASKQQGNRQTTTKSTQQDIKLSGEFAANKGKLPWPADGPVVETFGKHNHPVYTTLVMPANNGVNIGLSPDAEVKAVYDGEVKRIIVMPGYGRCILVQHGDYFTFYCKLGHVDVKNGDKVKTGQTLGRIDTIDGQTELHFEVWKEKEPENPELWLRKK
ncbi:MAG: peptidoglycan DD-metalloendopeptidase family protein [Bacteroidales bacterium]|jgi:septal ring factor EnvC (AmiA/AmiB activator)|nr:peptidoglycan DD-metalloendopeptidase family protein [Bacteroidales bacterium]MDY6443754.1 peptidoglycan DD-metalloendopeptidase family protein [Bacteroidales bacterium]